jgi:hypothetical protein
MMPTNQDPSVQQATLSFFAPVVAAYAGAIGIWWTVTTLWPRSWPPRRPPPTTDRPWLELVVCAGVVVAVLAMGQLYQHDLLLPRSGSAWFAANQVLIWAPLLLALAVRGQGGSTVWVTADGLPAKIGWGLGLGVLACAVFDGLRGELDRLPEHLQRAVELRSLAHLFPVFMEGVGLAFLFVRLEWALGRTVALVLPAVLFAAAHVPRALADGASGAHIATFFVFNTLFVAAVLAAIRRGRDVVWLGIVHYLMDVPTGAF